MIPEEIFDALSIVLTSVLINSMISKIEKYFSITVKFINDKHEFISKLFYMFWWKDIHLYHHASTPHVKNHMILTSLSFYSFLYTLLTLSLTRMNKRKEAVW